MPKKKHLLKGKVEYTGDQALKVLKDLYDIYNKGAMNNGLTDDYRDKLSDAATELSHQISEISQKLFAGWTEAFQQDVVKLELAVAETQKDIADLIQAKVTAKKVADFARVVDDSLAIAAGIAKSFH
jgi:hypothetical protein